MARKPRKKKFKGPLLIGDLPIEEIQKVVDHLTANYPTSGQLPTYIEELNRRG
ncbi:MAG: hypothetical protein ACRC6V_04810 [Bacteroidales bacterium]